MEQALLEQQGGSIKPLLMQVGFDVAALRKALTRFRDKDPSRAGSVMMSIAANFSDADIAGLAAYLQNFPSDPIAAVKP